jgi:hypothetical protein
MEAVGMARKLEPLLISRSLLSLFVLRARKNPSFESH